MATPSRTACAGCTRTVFPSARAQGSLLTKDGIAYDHEGRDAYSVTVRTSDGQGGRATIVVGITVTDVDEPPGGPPAGVVVTPRNTALTVTWNAAPDEAGKPPVTGYEVTHRTGDGGEWLEGLIVDSRTDTSAMLTGLTNEQLYQVRVRTLNDEGASEWSMNRIWRAHRGSGGGGCHPRPEPDRGRVPLSV